MKRIFFLFISVLISIATYSQNKDPLPSLNSIRTPNSPAFSVLGVQPTSVERPNTPADLAVAMDNATEGFKKFPQNFAVEFSPYWMSKAPVSLDWRRDTVRSLDESVIRTFSASVAAISKEFNKKELRGLSYGVRAFLLSGKTSGKSIGAIKALEKQLEEFSARYNEMAAAKERAIAVEYFSRIKAAETEEERKQIGLWYADERMKIAGIKEQWLKEQDEKIKNQQQEFAPQREGLIVEIAYAGAYRNDTANTDLKKNGYAFWITPSYVTGDYSLVGVYRQVKDSSSNKSQEYGVRLIYSKDRYAISAEYLKGKYDSEVALPNRERFSFLFEYMLDEKLWLSLSLGEDNKNIQGTQSIFSTLGIRYNFAKNRYSF